jgi:hypothetical protein
MCVCVCVCVCVNRKMALRAEAGTTGAVVEA